VDLEVVEPMRTAVWLAVAAIVDACIYSETEHARLM